MRLSHDLPCRLCRLMFAALMTLAWAGVTQAGAAQAGAPTPGGATEVKALAAWVGKVMAAVEESEKFLRRDTFDPAAVVSVVGRDPDGLVQWVRAETAWVPYRGALRGARGVLMDRMGNSLDRSLLLAELLRAAGHRARLARAELSENQASALLNRLKELPAKPDAAATADTWDQTLERQAKELGVEPERLRRDVEKLASPITRLAEDLAQRVADQVPALVEALGDAGGAVRKTGDADAAPPNPAAGSGPVAAMRDHWWVQRQEGGRWVDLDPLAPDPAPRAAATRDLPRDPDALPVDASHCHAVTFRVIIEQWKGGRLKQSPVLEQTLRPAEVIAKRIVFSHTPMNWPAGLDLAAEADPGAKVRAELLRQEGWVPFLRVGDATVTKAAFMNSGEIDPRPNLDAIANTGKAVAGAVAKVKGIFDELDAATPAPGTKAAGDGGGILTGEWIEYELRVPGSEAVRIRRDVFDLVGPAARAAASARDAAVPMPTVGEAQRLERALALGGASEIVLLGATPSSEFIQHRLNQDVLAARGAVGAMLNAGASGNEAAALRPAEKLSPMPVQPYLFAVARSSWSRGRERTFLARPNVVTFHRRFGAAPAGGLTRRTIFDIVANDVDVRPAAADDANAAARLRLEQGVVDTNLESLLVAGPPPEEGGVKVNTADLFAKAEARGTKWATLRAGDGNTDAALAGAALSADIRQRIREDLNAGYVVVVPTQAVEVGGGVAAAGWWRVDPASGQALGMTEAGGATFVEYAMRISVSLGVGLWTFIGCGGATGSGGKALGCAICGVIAGVLTYLAFVAAAASAAGGAAAAAGGVGGAAQAVGTTGGVAGAGGASVACNAVSALAS